MQMFVKHIYIIIVYTQLLNGRRHTDPMQELLEAAYTFKCIFLVIA